MTGMERNSTSQLVATFRRLFAGPESLLLAMVVILIEIAGPPSEGKVRRDLDDVVWVVLLPMLFMLGCSMARYRSLPLTSAVVDMAMQSFQRMRTRLVVSMGLDFHPEAGPRLPPFTSLRRTAIALGLASIVLLPVTGLGLEVLSALRVRGLYSVYVLGLTAAWVVLLAGIAIQLPATALVVLEVAKRRTRLSAAGRMLVAALSMVLVIILLISLDQALGLRGCLGLLALGCLLPTFAPPVEPPRGPWLILAVGRGGSPRTAPISQVIRDGWRMMAFGSFVVVAALASLDKPLAEPFPVTDTLLRVNGWLAAWLFTGGALLAVGEFNRRRRLNDPAFPRSRVLWAVPGPDASALAAEEHGIVASGWRLHVAEGLPGPDDADLIVGLPSGAAPRSTVPLSQVPPALFLLRPDAGAVLDEAEERDKSSRALSALGRLLASARPGQGDRGEGTFVVPHCWLVLGLTRDDDRGGLERPPNATLGLTYRAALGTRLRRFLFEVFDRAAIDVLFIEDQITPEQTSAVLEMLFERHVARVEPGPVAEHDFVGLEGVRVVLQDVEPELDGIPGVDAHVTRHAISRARILIIGRDRRDDDDDDGPPTEGESSDLWLKQALSSLLPRVQTV